MPTSDPMPAMRYFFLLSAFLLTAVLLTACVSASGVVDENTADRVPRGSNLVRVQYDDPRAQAEEQLLREFARRGIAVQDEEASTWTTKPNNIGQETLLLLTVSFLQADGGNTTEVLMRGQWGLTSSMAAGLSAGFGTGGAGGKSTNVAKWTYGRPKRAFGAVADIATTAFPNAKLTFEGE
jgi:hypothetical protein